MKKEKTSGSLASVQGVSYVIILNYCSELQSCPYYDRNGTCLSV